MAGTRAAGRRFMLYAESGGQCRVVRMLTREDGELMVLGGKARRRYDDYSGELIGYTLGLAGRNERGDYDVRSLASSASISAREMDENLMPSRTRGMSEDRRMLEKQPEDRVERVQAKVRVYAIVGAAPGDILRAWPRD